MSWLLREHGRKKKVIELEYKTEDSGIIHEKVYPMFALYSDIYLRRKGLGK